MGWKYLFTSAFMAKEEFVDGDKENKCCFRNPMDRIRADGKSGGLHCDII